MSEKRFVLFGLDNETIKDDVTKECYWVNEYVQRKKLVDLLNEQQSTINKLKEENEQLRNSIQSFLKEADIFSEEATEHDIVAYREMGKFDNKDAYYLACAIAELKKVIDDE